MSELVGNPEDWFSCIMAHIVCLHHMKLHILNLNALDLILTLARNKH